MQNHKEISFFVPGIAVPKARPRFANKSVYTPSRTKAWERAISIAAGAATFPRKPSAEGRFHVELAFALKDGRSLRADVDNLAKSVLDAMNAKVYKDDSQVLSLSVRKFLAKDCALGVAVRVSELSDC